MKAGPPLPPQHIIPSEYGVGQFMPPADTRRDPTPEEIAARAEANRVPYEDIERMLGPEVFTFEHGLLGTIETTDHHENRPHSRSAVSPPRRDRTRLRPDPNHRSPYEIFGRTSYKTFGRSSSKKRERARRPPLATIRCHECTHSIDGVCIHAAERPLLSFLSRVRRAIADDEATELPLVRGLWRRLETEA